MGNSRFSIFGFSGSSDGTKGLFYGADMKITVGLPMWSIINMSNGAVEAPASSVKIASGFSGRMFAVGGFYISPSEYVIQLSYGGIAPYAEYFVKIGIPNHTTPLYIAYLNCTSCSTGPYSKSGLVGTRIL